MICKHCGLEFTDSKVKGGYCCNKCEVEYKKWNFSPNTICPVCKKEFYIKQSHIDRYKNVCCSLDCSRELKKETMLGEKNHQFGLTGELNSSFKDYKIIRHGYVSLYEPNHPMANKNGRILEHRYLAEKFLMEDRHSVGIEGKLYLSSDYDVHHLDENKLNNSLENLQILTKSEHTTLHNKIDSETIFVKKIKQDTPDFNRIKKGDWIDLYVMGGNVASNDSKSIEDTQSKNHDLFKDNDNLFFKAGDVLWLNFGIAMQLPKNHEGEIRPRSSTFKNTGLLLTNSVGTIDESYCGDNDEWRGMFYATRDGFIKKLDRLVQFRVSEKMKNHKISYVEHLNNENRGGYGTTGK